MPPRQLAPVTAGEEDALVKSAATLIADLYVCSRLLLWGRSLFLECEWVSCGLFAPGVVTAFSCLNDFCVSHAREWR